MIEHFRKALPGKGIPEKDFPKYIRDERLALGSDLTTEQKIRIGRQYQERTGIVEPDLSVPDVLKKELFKIEGQVINNIEGPGSTYDMVKENPGLTNEQLLRIYEKIGPD